MVKEMLSVLMDGIRDVNMFIDYYEQCDSPIDQFFMEHAKSRMTQLQEDYRYVSEQIGLTDKVREKDQIAEALQSYLECEINSAKNRM